MSDLWRFRLGFGFLAVGYLGALAWQPYPGDFLVKALPVWLAAGWAFRRASDKTGRRIGFGLLWSAAGDVALALDDRFFLAGLGAFFVAHLCYIAGFAPAARATRAGLARAAGVAIYGLGLGATLGSAVGWAPPILAYAAVLTVMGMTAALRAGHPQVFIGALAFIVSDSLLATHRFLTPLPLAPLWVMITYYAAQGLIAGGLIAESAARKPAAPPSPNSP